MDDGTKLTVKEHIIGWVIGLSLLSVGLYVVNALSYSPDGTSFTQEEILNYEYNNVCDTDMSCQGEL